MLLTYMQHYHGMICLHDPDPHKKKQVLISHYILKGKRQHTISTLKDTDKMIFPKQPEGQEAEIYIGFVKFLYSKTDDLIFNVPKGRIEKIELSRLIKFLSTKGENCKHFERL